MLGEPEHLDKKHLQFVADLEWHAADNADAQLGGGAVEAFPEPAGLSDDAAPDRARTRRCSRRRAARIRQASIPRFIYGRLKRNYADDARAPCGSTWRRASASKQVIRRKSGVQLCEPVPSLYSRAVFKEMIDRRDSAMSSSSSRRTTGCGAREAGRLAGAPRARPLTSSISTSGTTSPPGTACSRTSSSCHSRRRRRPWTSWRNSPDRALRLRGLLQAVSDNTYLIQPADGSKPGGVEGAAAAAKKALEDRAQKLNEKLGGLFGMKMASPPGCRECW